SEFDAAMAPPKACHSTVAETAPANTSPIERIFILGLILGLARSRRSTIGRNRSLRRSSGTLYIIPVGHLAAGRRSASPVRRFFPLYLQALRLAETVPARP